MRDSILPPTKGIDTVISRSTVSVTPSPAAATSTEPAIWPGLPGMVTVTSPCVGEVQRSSWRIRISLPTNFLAKPGMRSAPWVWSTVTVVPSMVTSLFSTSFWASHTASRKAGVISMPVTCSTVAPG